MQISPDGKTLTTHLENVPVVDAFSFPPPVPSEIAFDEVNISPYQLVRARTSFDITYTKTPGTAHRISPSTEDPLSPLNWAGTERNGFFVHHEEQDDNDDVEAEEQPSSLSSQPADMSQSAATANTNKPMKFALLRGRVPIKVSH